LGIPRGLEKVVGLKVEKDNDDEALEPGEAEIDPDAECGRPAPG
jgi:hypothetical protein